MHQLLRTLSPLRRARWHLANYGDCSASSVRTDTGSRSDASEPGRSRHCVQYLDHRRGDADLDRLRHTRWVANERYESRVGIRSGPEPTEPTRTAQRKAFWLDYDWLVAHPDANEYVRPRIPYEFGPDDASDEPEWSQNWGEPNSREQWVLIRRMDSSIPSWLTVPLLGTFPQPQSAAMESHWQWNAGRPAD
jgi:hypothetical protein